MERIEFQGAGVTIVGDLAGPDRATPILFLHGGGQTRQSWGGAIAEAARRGYRAITIDLRGHGESGWSPGGLYDMNQFADDVRAVVATLVPPPVLVGASLGGLTALLAGHVPPRGACIDHPSGWKIEVTDADERRVNRLRLHPPVPEPEDAAA